MGGDVGEQARSAGARARRSTFVEGLVRLGVASYGLVHLVIAWLALRLAFGEREGRASGSGALREVAQQPTGDVLLWAVAAGLGALVVWQVLEILVDDGDSGGSNDGADAARRWGTRGKHALRAVAYGTLAWSSATLAAGSARGSGGGGTDTLTGRLMAQPFGPVLVGAVGVGVIAWGCVNVAKGLTDGFEKHLDLDGAPAPVESGLRWSGRAGYAARGIAVMVIGGLFLWAAVTHDSEKSGGLDQALTRLLQAPAGPVLVCLVAAGFAGFGIFCLGWAARFRR